MADEEAERPEDPWLTLAEIAEELRMSPATIRSWISKGTLRAMRAGQRKWLVRRSELDRMLRGEDFEDAPPPPPDPPAPGRRRRQRRFPDTITPPIARPGQPEEENIDPEEWLAVVQWEWLSALRQSEMAPPDAGFPGRLQYIAEAAARKAAALALFPADEVMRWDGEPDAFGLTLSYELRRDGNRPGPPELWVQFDSAVDRLGIAMQAGQAGLLRCSLDSCRSPCTTSPSRLTATAAATASGRSSRGWMQSTKTPATSPQARRKLQSEVFREPCFSSLQLGPPPPRQHWGSGASARLTYPPSTC